jgi:predicted transcriptional regulator
MEKEELVSITADIVAAHVGNNNVSISDLGGLIASVHSALSAPGEAPPAAEPEQVSVRASIKPDHLVCMGCGSQQKMLKRHLFCRPQPHPAAISRRLQSFLQLPDVGTQVCGKTARARACGRARPQPGAAPEQARPWRDLCRAGQRGRKRT